MHGWEFAQQHIDEARRLSQELGGTDQDVKAYFFSLSREELRLILNDYERDNGRQARDYAEEALPYWRSGDRHMSGLVAGRLYKLLPPRMPTATKFKMVETLWRKHGPRSDSSVSVGPDCAEDAIVESVRSYLQQVVVSYTVPDELERRFQWLAQNDATLKQQLLNNMQQIELQVIVEGLRQKVPAFVRQIREHGDITKKLCQIIQIGNHTLHVDFDARFSGIRVGRHSPTVAMGTGSSRNDELWSKYGCLVVIAIIIAVSLLSKRC